MRRKVCLNLHLKVTLCCCAMLILSSSNIGVNSGRNGRSHSSQTHQRSSIHNTYPSLQSSSNPKVRSASSQITTIDAKTNGIRRNLLGPNVCGFQCCNGWKADETSVCLTPICKQPCLNGGRCVNPDKCWCKSGFSGDYCEIQKTEITTTLQGYRNKRNHGPKQTIIHVRYKNPTSIRGHSSVSRAASSCTSLTCFNGGTCIDGLCRCPKGYMGKRCDKVLLIQTSLDAVLPGQNLEKVSASHVAIKLCKALCVHGICQVGRSPLCKCHPGYYGAMCELSRNRRRHKAVEPRNILTGLKYSNNFLRPVITYSGKKSSRLSSLSDFTKYGRCYKRFGGRLCAIAYKGHMSREACCNTGYGDAWGSTCSSCKSSVISDRRGAVVPAIEKHCPVGFEEINGKCDDINECQQGKRVCLHGVCINSRGSYWCKCNRGFYQHVSRTLCLPSARTVHYHGNRLFVKCYLSMNGVDNCYDSIASFRGNKAACCCSIGVAWGPYCEKCPERNSVDYNLLCPRGNGFHKPNIKAKSYVPTASSNQSPRRTNIYKPRTPRTKILGHSKKFDLPSTVIDKVPATTSPRSKETLSTSLVKTEESTTKLSLSITTTPETTTRNATSLFDDNDISVVKGMADEFSKSVTTTSSIPHKTNEQKAQDTTTHENSLTKGEIDEQIGEISLFDLNSNHSALGKSSTKQESTTQTTKKIKPTTGIIGEETSAFVSTATRIINSATTEPLPRNLSTFSYQEQTDQVAEEFTGEQSENFVSHVTKHSSTTVNSRLSTSDIAELGGGPNTLITAATNPTVMSTDVVAVSTKMDSIPPNTTIASVTTTLEPLIDVIPVEVLNGEDSHQDDSSRVDSRPIDLGNEFQDFQDSHSEPIIPDIISLENSEDDLHDDKLDEETYNEQEGDDDFEEIDYGDINGNVIEVVAIPEENYDDEITDEETTTDIAKMGSGIRKVTIVPSIPENKDDRDEMLHEHLELAPADAEEIEESRDENDDNTHPENGEREPAVDQSESSENEQQISTNDDGITIEDSESETDFDQNKGIDDKMLLTQKIQHPIKIELHKIPLSPIGVNKKAYYTNDYTSLSEQEEAPTACQPNPCLHGGICSEGSDDSSFACQCTNGYFGRFCKTKDLCMPDPCVHAIGCESGMGFYYCDCLPEYFGKNCDQKIDSCDPNPCEHGTCTNQTDGYSCQCTGGYSGRNCTEDLNECEVHKTICGNQAVCVNSIGSYSCVMPRKCSFGYQRNSFGVCQDINECLNTTLCKGGRCVNHPGSYGCECYIGYRATAEGNGCEDVVECDFVQCGGTASCRNTIGSYECQCPNPNEQYDKSTQKCLSPLSQQEIDARREPCYPTYFSCQNPLSLNLTREECCCTIGRSWGNCNAKRNCPMLRSPSYKNLCPIGRGLTGTAVPYSVRDLDECVLFGTNNVCRNGRCMNSFGSYECVCYPGFYYNRRVQACDDINECRMRNKCRGGFCINKPGSYRCKCPTGSVLQHQGFSSNCRATRTSMPTRFPYRPSMMTTAVETAKPKDNFFKDVCFKRLSRNYMCDMKLPNKYTYRQCCCRMGVAWGSRCSKCPNPSSNDYKFLCKHLPNVRVEKPPIMVVDDTEESNGDAAFHEHECGIAGGCMNGKCVRTEDGITCDCNYGYQFEAESMTCTDIDECTNLSPELCVNGVCINLSGSFHCVCKTGFERSLYDPSLCVPVASEIDYSEDLTHESDLALT